MELNQAEAETLRALARHARRAGAGAAGSARVGVRCRKTNSAVAEVLGTTPRRSAKGVPVRPERVEGRWGIESLILPSHSCAPPTLLISMPHVGRTYW